MMARLQSLQSAIGDHGPAVVRWRRELARALSAERPLLLEGQGTERISHVVGCDPADDERQREYAPRGHTRGPSRGFPHRWARGTHKDFWIDLDAGTWSSRANAHLSSLPRGATKTCALTATVEVRNFFQSGVRRSAPVCRHAGPPTWFFIFLAGHIACNAALDAADGAVKVLQHAKARGTRLLVGLAGSTGSQPDSPLRFRYTVALEHVAHVFLAPTTLQDEPDC